MNSIKQEVIDKAEINNLIELVSKVFYRNVYFQLTDTDFFYISSLIKS
jgi:hypothetical protein